MLFVNLGNKVLKTVRIFLLFGLNLESTQLKDTLQAHFKINQHKEVLNYQEKSAIGVKQYFKKIITSKRSLFDLYE